VSDVVFVPGPLLIVRPGEQTCGWADSWREFLDAERARGCRPSRADLEMLEALSRLASGSTAVTGSVGAASADRSGTLIRDEMSTREAAEMLKLSDRRVRQLCELPAPRLRSRKPNGRVLIETTSVLEELLRREQQARLEVA
jgi:hypothetical protein